MKPLSVNKPIFMEGSLGIYFKEISRYELLTIEEEKDLSIRIKEDDSIALETLVKANLRFVVGVACNYQNQGVSLSDLINEGNLGLI